MKRQKEKQDQTEESQSGAISETEAAVQQTGKLRRQLVDDPPLLTRALYSLTPLLDVRRLSVFGEA